MVLAADIGGTNCRLALFEGPRLTRRWQVPTSGPRFRDALPADLGAVDAACIAVAGPVQDGQSSLTNSAWVFDQADLSETLGCPARLANDFEAAARGLPLVPPALLEQLGGDAPDPTGLRVAVGPGTGLGQALLLPQPGGWRVQPTEGGHMDLAPNSVEQAALWSWLHAQHDHVSLERVLSGPGLITLHAFFRSQGLDGPPPAAPEDVSTGHDPASRAAVRCFVEFLGAHLGNLALGVWPSGGLYLCGGISPRLPLLELGLLDALHAKGRFRDLVARVPVLLVRDPDLGLRGAAALAQELDPAPSTGAR
jgi:glucokinase